MNFNNLAQFMKNCAFFTNLEKGIWLSIMKYVLLFIALIIIMARARWFVGVKGVKSNWFSYSVFSILSSVILTILHMNIYGSWRDEITKDDLISASAIFTAYIIIFVLYPILSKIINELSWWFRIHNVTNEGINKIRILNNQALFLKKIMPCLVKRLVEIEVKMISSSWGVEGKSTVFVKVLSKMFILK